MSNRVVPGEAANGVSDASGNFSVAYVLPRGGHIYGLTASYRPNVDAPNAAQQAGFARIVVRIGDSTTLGIAAVSSNGADARKGGRVLADQKVGSIYYGGSALSMALEGDVNANEIVVVEGSRGQDTDGNPVDAEWSVVVLGSERGTTARLR